MLCNSHLCLWYRRASKASAAKSTAATSALEGPSGAGDEGTDTAAASEAHAGPQRAARGASSSRVRGGRGGRGRGRASRGKTGTAIGNADGSSAAAAAAVDAVETAALAPCGADKRPARGRRRAAASASLPAGPAVRAAASPPLPSGHFLGRGKTSGFSSHAPSGSAASPSMSSLARAPGSNRNFSSSPEFLDTAADSAEPWCYNASPRAASASCGSQDWPFPSASQQQSVRGRLDEDDDIITGSADVGGSPEQAIPLEEDAWCYVAGSPGGFLTRRSATPRSAGMSPAGCSVAGRESAALSEPVCLVSDSDSEAPGPRCACHFPPPLYKHIIMEVIGKSARPCGFAACPCMCVQHRACNKVVQGTLREAMACTQHAVAVILYGIVLVSPRVICLAHFLYKDLAPGFSLNSLPTDGVRAAHLQRGSVACQLRGNSRRTSTPGHSRQGAETRQVPAS